MPKTKIAIFASGTGSNAINLIRFFKNSRTIEVGFVLSNNPDAPILESAQALGVNVMYHNNAKVANGEFLVSLCKNNGVDWIILAGYLRLVPKELISAYFNAMINLHPSLLPKYGGKGMFGSNVHRAVIANNEKESGITIHFINQEFDKGRIIAQFHCELNINDDVAELEQKIRFLEKSYLPVVVQNTILT